MALTLFASDARSPKKRKRPAFAIRPYLLALLAGCGLAGTPAPARSAERFVPKVLVITTYEVGADTGDIPGELQNWVEKRNLRQKIDVPGLSHPVLTDGKGLFVMLSGTMARSGIGLMTLATDRRFDLRKSYMLLSGIAGGDPRQVTLGSAIWIDTVVDGDPAYEMDSREAPANWPYGLIPLGATEPNTAPPNIDQSVVAGISTDGVGGADRVALRTNPSLRKWALDLTRNTSLMDSPEAAADRRKFVGFPKAQAGPVVASGDSVAASRFWTGNVMTQWARDWVRIYTRNQGALSIADCEDQAIIFAAAKLGAAGRVDPDRLMILRTVSNFTTPPPGVASTKDLYSDLLRHSGYNLAIDAAYRVGNVVATEIQNDWSRYATKTP